MTDRKSIKLDPIDMKKRLGARLKQLRRNAGYSSAEKFANDHDFSRPTYGKYEQGKPLRNNSNSIKIRHIRGAKERLEQAHHVMGISNQLSSELQDIFNRWSKVRVTDPELRNLILRAMVPNKEVFQNIEAGKEDELSTCFKNICDNAFAYAMIHPSQQLETTKGTLFGAYNVVTGYFQNVRNYKDEEARLKSIMFGNALTKTQSAFNLCMDFMKN